jgi:tripartite-type tricarboxylate transporter receptor subunit TctC
MKKILLFTIVLFLIGVSGVFAGGQQGDGAADKPIWPTVRNVEIVVPATAGSGTDVAARALAAYWHRTLGANFFITNDASGGYTVAYEMGRNADPDGSTLLFATASLPYVYYFDIYDHLVTEDFSIMNVLQFHVDQGCLVVQADSPFKTLKDLADYAKANPNRLSIGTGAGNMVYVSALTWEEALGGVVFRKVDGSDNNERTANLLGGHNDMATLAASVALPYVETGDMRILGIAQNERSKLFPDIPSWAELGYPLKRESKQAYIVCGPKAVDEKVAQFICDSIKGFQDSPECKAILEKGPIMGAEYRYYTREESIKVVEDLCAIGETLVK